jgi:hypothetical protein
MKEKKQIRIKAAQDYIVDLGFYEWHLFEDIPADLFDEVFELIDEGFRGWLYFFDDFDQAFRKELKIQKSTDKQPLRAIRLERFERLNKQRFEQHQFNEGGSG